ncbi:hypothetical protein [Mycobacterium sp. MMS18-G62]
MVTVPAVVWRGGAFRRAVTVGGAVGLGLAAMAWLDSGFVLSAAIVFVVTGLVYGIWMHRRMARYWPGARNLTGAQRVEVARTARRGEQLHDAGLAQAVIDYSRGMHASVDRARPFRWVFPLVLVVALGTAVWDAVFGSWGNAVASGIYIVLLALELLWWPKRQAQLLANADRAAEMAAGLKTSD